MMHLTNDENGVICACGNPVAAHRCPSSSGAAPRQPKTASCRACGEKAHQNLEKTTVALECLYRQWAKATGQLTVTASNRLVMPDVSVQSLERITQWIKDGMQNRHASTANADGTFQAPDTAAVLKRMAERAADAPAQPGDEPTTPPAASVDLLDAAADLDATITATTAASDAMSEDDLTTVLANSLHTDECMPPIPDIALDTPLVATSSRPSDDFDIAAIF